MKKPTLCVIFGGKTGEYEVSLKTAYSFLTNIDKEKYELIKVGITKKGEWLLYDGDNEAILNDEWKNIRLPHVTIDLSYGWLLVYDEKIYTVNIDKVFLATHGEYGEDGRIQGVLETAGINYVGSDSFSSFLCMDKHLCKLLAKENGIRVAESLVLYKGENYEEKIEKITYPVFVKPSLSGSSVGISLVKGSRELPLALEKAFEICPKVLLEEKIVGKEVEIGVITNGASLELSPIGEIKYNSDFYDYNTKYTLGRCEYIIPSEINRESKEKIIEYTKRLVTCLKIRDYARFDFFVKENGDVVLGEINTLPGFTEGSMLPKLFLEKGYSYSHLLYKILKM